MLVVRQRSVRFRIAFLLGAVVVFVFPALVWYALAWPGWLTWPSGTSTAGFFCGVIAGVIVLFEMALWLRKKARGRRRLLFIPLGPAKTWMWLHIWLGILALPLALIHSGLAFGGLLGAWTLGLFLVVFASGVWGLALQQSLPRRMLSEIPEETIATQIGPVMESYSREGRQLVEALTSPAPYGEDETLARFPASLARVTPLAPSPLTIQLRRFFEEEVALLVSGLSAPSRLRSADDAQHAFALLYQQLPSHGHDSVRRLEQMCQLRRQLDRQARLDWWLQSWLAVHFPLSVALTVLLVWHAGAALKYW